MVSSFNTMAMSLSVCMREESLVQAVYNKIDTYDTYMQSEALKCDHLNIM